jgi:hypothetical protein
MNHRRFDDTDALPGQEPPFATVATNATVSFACHGSVATVASVAAPYHGSTQYCAG